MSWVSLIEITHTFCTQGETGSAHSERSWRDSYHCPLRRDAPRLRSLALAASLRWGGPDSIEAPLSPRSIRYMLGGGRLVRGGSRRIHRAGRVSA